MTEAQLVRDQEVCIAGLRVVEQQAGLASKLFKITCIFKEIILNIVCYIKVYAHLVTFSSTGFTGCFTSAPHKIHYMVGLI